MYTRHRNSRARILAAVLLGTGLSFCARTGTAGEETLSPSERRDCLLAAFRRDGHDAVPELNEALQDPSAMVRRTAAHLLARPGEPARPALEQALEHPDGQVRRIAAAALPRDEILALHIERFLEDPDPVVRGWAWGYLAREAPGEDITPRVMAYLSGRIEGGDAEVRQQTGRLVVRWYTATGPAPEYRDLLEVLAHDSDPQVRVLAQRVLWPFAFDLPRIPVQARAPDAAWTRISETRLPADGWRFRIDPPGPPGHARGWYEPGHDDRDWARLAIEQWWTDAVDSGYVGAAWYRSEFDVPAGDFDGAELHFEAVDENGWVWVNGRYAGQHAVGAAGWETPFRIDITDHVRPGETNHLAVRVKNSAGAGGIHGPVHLRLYRASGHGQGRQE